MVSLSRLLAAADDSSAEEPAATPLPSRASRDCALPPFLASDSIPVRLRLSQSFKSISPSSKESVPNSNFFRPSPPLPLQRLLRDLGPEATEPSNMATLARTLAHFGRPSEAAVASALLFLTTHVPSESASLDSHTMFHLFALFCGDPENSSIDPVVQQAVATTSNSPSEWRADVLVQAVSSIAMQFNAPLDWRLVIHSLDVEGLETQLTQGAFVEIAKAYIAGTGGTLLPADCILDRWRYPKAQLCIISHALTSPECINWDVLEVFDGSLAEDFVSPYSRVILIEKLVELDARDLLNYAVKENSNAVLLSLACAKPQNNTALQQKLTVTLLAPLFAVFPTSERPLRQMWNVSPTLVEAGIVSMWKKDPTTLRTALSISLDMQILPDLLSSNVSVDFSLELAMLAFQENVLKFESWLMEFLTTKGGHAASRIVVCLAHKARIDQVASSQISVNVVRIILRCLINWARRSHANQEKEFIEGVQDVYEVYCRLDQRIVDLAPAADLDNAKVIVGSEVPSPSPPSDAASTAAAMLLPIAPGSNGSSTTFPPSVEKETDLFFQKLYRSELLPDQAVDVLRRRKASNTEHDAQVFNCMLHTLFDEYRFFKDYPDQQLKITGVVFGSIIQFGLVSGGLLGLAVRCVLDALRTVEPAPHPVGRFTKFGLCALERFKNRFYEWPQFCSRILELSRLKDIAPGLIGEVQQALDINGAVIPSAAEKKIGLAEVDRQSVNEPIHSTEERVPPVSSLRDPAADADAVRDLVASPPLSTSNTPLKGRSVSSTSLRSSPNGGVDGSLGLSPLDLSNLLGLSRDEASQIVVPDEGTQDKMKFIFNNLSQSMMDEKVHEMLRILKPKYFSFFAVYIVVKRASSEANFHCLYVELLEKMSEQAQSLLPFVYRTTYKRVNVLLALDRSKTSADRGILKSLGSWIGSLTLARNKPILRRELDLKDALLNAYSNGRLTTVIPFVAKVLEACRDSIVFKPTNPWVRGVLSLMKEICSLEDLKLNMKFELQILSKHIGIDVNSIVSSDMLRLRPAPDKTQNPDFTKKASASPPQTSPSATASSSPEIRRNFPHVPVGPRPGAPVFTLSEQRNGLPSLSKPIPGGLPTSSGRMNLNHGLLSGNISAVSHETIGELSNMLQSASISSGVAGSTQGQRSAIHSQSTVGIASVPPSTTHRTSSSLNAAEMLVPNLSQMVNVSPSLGLLDTSPNLKRLVPLAIDRAIREIIQPVVERSCAIAFLTTKELTSKDFANAPEHDVSKVRRAAMQMVQQLAGSLALVTSKEPLRVSMGHQLRNILSPSIVADQNMIDQTAQVICNANLDVGCAIIERHAKEKAVRDLNEKIGSTFANRRQSNPASTYGMVPGPDLYRVYEEFSRIHRAGVVPSQYQSQLPVSSQAFQPVSQPPASKPSDSTKDMQGFYQSNNQTSQFVSEQRTSGTGQESRGTLRAPANHVAPRVLGSSQGRGSMLSSSSVPGRRMPPTTASAPDPTPRPPLLLNAPRSRLAPTTALATILLHVCAPSSVNGYGSSQNVSQQSNNSSGTGEVELSTQEVLERFNSIYPQLITEIDATILSSSDKDMKLADLPPDHEIHALWVQIPAAVKRSNTADEAGMAVAQKVFKRLFEGESNMYREAHVLILEGLRDSCRRVSRELASWLAFSEERRKLNLECILVLLRPGSLLSKTSYDEILAKAIDNGRNITALSFACTLIRKAVIEEPLATAGDFYLTLEVILKVARKQNMPNMPMDAEELFSLVESARNVVHKPENTNTSINVNMESHTVAPKIAKDNENGDSTTYKEVAAQLLLDWHRVLTSDPDRSISDQSVVSFVAQARSLSLANGEAAEKFFRVAVEIVCSATSHALNSGSGFSNVPAEMLDAPYTAAESLVCLVSTMCYTDRSLSLPNRIGVVQLVYYFLVAVAKDAMMRCAKGDLRCHFRLLSCFMNQLSAGSLSRERSTAENVEANLDRIVTAYSRKLEDVSSGAKGVEFVEDKESGMLRWIQDLGSINHHEKDVNLNNLQIQGVLVGVLSLCSPSHIPRFAFYWLELLANKEFFPCLLSVRNVNGWPLFRHLLMSFLKFMSGYLNKAEEPLTAVVRKLYNGLLRVLLVLLHDFPEFLCAYHLDFCHTIPNRCVQLRNLILSSFPKQMRLPDPFAPDLDVKRLPDMINPPVILSDFISPLQESGVKAIVDSYLNPAERPLGQKRVADLGRYICSTNDSGEVEVNLVVLNSLMVYLAQNVSSSNEQYNRSSSSTEVIRLLASQLDCEGQILLFNALTNQLRYPNSHTRYFSSMILMLFRETSSESIKEEIAKVLVERLIANRPHPWGLLITFVELLKNPDYSFWSYSFVTCAPEIEELFQNVSRYCMAPSFQNKRQSLVAAQ